MTKIKSLSSHYVDKAVPIEDRLRVMGNHIRLTLPGEGLIVSHELLYEAVDTILRLKQSAQVSDKTQ